MLLVLLSFGFFSCEERKVGNMPETPETKQVEKKPEPKGGEYSVQPLVMTGAKGSFKILPKAGYKINVEYPWKMKPGEKGVSVEDIKLDEKKAILELKIPKSLEKSTLSINASFSVCNDDKCMIYRDEKLKVAQAP